MTTALDLDAYLARIGYAGPRQPTLETLRGLHQGHTHSIGFENLNPLLGLPVRLDLPALEQKLVHEGRGGYCYEQNLLFRAALLHLGFDVTGLVASVMWMLPEGVSTPRTHMILRVTIDGVDYLADVGFGGPTLTGPIRLEAELEQATPHEPYRLIRQGSDFGLQSLVRHHWQPLYRFDLQEQQHSDYEVGNWYVATHPESLFVSTLLAARPVPGKRYALRNRDLAIHHLGGETEKRTLTNGSELRETLETLFNLRVPQGAEVDALLSRIAQQGAKT